LQLAKRDKYGRNVEKTTGLEKFYEFEDDEEKKDDEAESSEDVQPPAKKVFHLQIVKQ
jgi:hypothetical protein